MVGRPPLKGKGKTASAPRAEARPALEDGLAPGTRRPILDTGERLWLPLLAAIATVADRLGIPAAQAWDTIKNDIRRGELRAEHRTEGGERCDFEPNWIDFAQFRSSKSKRDMLWFDRREAQNRTGAGALPPSRMREVAVDKERLD